MSSIISTYTPGQIFVSIHFWEPPPCVQILALKVPLGSVHFSPFPRVTFLVEAASISHLGLLPFHNGLPAPIPPPPPPLHSPHSSQCELFTWWLWSCPDDPHQKLACPFSGSPFTLRVDAKIYPTVSSISVHAPFPPISLSSKHIRFSSTLRPPILKVTCLGKTSFISLA